MTYRAAIGRSSRASASIGSTSRPSAPEMALYLSLIVLALVGAGSVNARNIAPATAILEASFAISWLLIIQTGQLRRRALLILIVAMIYVSLKYALMDVFRPADLRDFVQAYKAFIYLIPLSFFAGRRVFSASRVSNVTTLLLWIFLTKYSYAKLFGLDHRPGVFTENNFELILLIGLVYVSYPAFAGAAGVRFLALLGIVLLSGSRSAAIAIVAAYGFLHLRPRQRHFAAHVTAALTILALVVLLFAARSSGADLSAIDRYVFLQVFVREVSSWPLWQLATGSMPLTPLSSGSCFQLGYYEKLFSFSGTGDCYSVVLHSYILRAIFDHGIIGLFLLYSALWMALSESGYAKFDRFGLLSIISASALSVSAFNSVYVAILLAVALGIRRDRPPHPPREPSAERQISSS